MRLALINIVIAVSMIFSVGTLTAQDYSVNCTVNQNPAPTGSRINLTVSFTNCQPKNNSLERPSIPGLQYLGGPSVSQQHQSINFKSTSTYSYTYTYKVVSKTNVKIPPVKVATNRGVMNSDPFILQVVQRGAVNSKKGMGNVSSAIEVNKTQVHLGEPVLIQYKIYSRYSNIRYAEEVPELQGFWKEELPKKQNNRNVRQINGIEYLEIIVKEVLAFPQQTGEFTLDGFDVYGMITMGFFNQKEFQTQSSPITVKVVPLPDGKPNHFMGTFGRLDIDAIVDVDSVNVNEAFNYELTYSGKGNLKLIREPDLDWPAEFEVFDPEIIDRINVTAAGESGKRTYKYAVIPRAAGTYDLPKVSVSFFNHIKNDYIVENADAGQISVKRDPNAIGGSTMYSPKSQVQVLNHDIRHISTDHGHWVAYKEGSGSVLNIWLLFLLGPAISAWAFIAKMRNESENNDVVGTRHKKALRVCNKALNNCKDYTQLGETIEVYLCSKLGFGRSSFSRDNAEKILSEQLSDTEAKAWSDLLKKCEMARFAPGALPEVKKTINEAKNLVKKSDGKISISRMAIVVWALLLPAFAISQTTDEDLDAQFEFANNAYLEGDYELAAATYEEISKEHKCFELEYNLGNCYYKLEEIGKTVLHYERAKLIDPLNDDLRANMLLADLRVTDKIEPLPGVGFERILGVLFAGKLLGKWLILSLVFWTLGFLLLAIRFIWKNNLLYPFASVGWIIMICISLVFSTLLYNTIDRVSTSACAVIMEDKVDVMSIPGETGLKLFHLHEGSRGCIMSVEGEWTEIRLDNGNVGWLPTAAIERI
tara:strand:- start:573 stop:3026 length:2454 start_codon:yes stop_codon:yes gene_type:complete